MAFEYARLLQQASVPSYALMMRQHGSRRSPAAHNVPGGACHKVSRGASRHVHVPAAHACICAHVRRRSQSATRTTKTYADNGAQAGRQRRVIVTVMRGWQNTQWLFSKALLSIEQTWSHASPLG
jgi:hypothetical protein